jgi:hypothetical protein
MRSSAILWTAAVSAFLAWPALFGQTTAAAQTTDLFTLVAQPGWTNTSQYSVTGAWGDFNTDGRLDLFALSTLAAANSPAVMNRLYLNLGNGNHWIKFDLEGKVSNGAAIGAKVRVRATIGGKTVWQMREVSGGNFCQNDLRPNLGLGDATVAELVRIEWPSGIVQELKDIPAGQIVTVTEPPAILALGEGRIRILCWSRQNFEVEASYDLQTWASLGLVATDLNRPVVLDPGAAGKPHRFYRAKAQ